MTRPLNILIVEDSQDDAELLLAGLRRAGFDPKWKLVDNEPDFLAGLENSPDIIISDYSMPHFNGLRAAKLLQKTHLDIPFILISGTMGEEVAVEAMKHGATDYLLKDRVARLGAAVEQALEKKRLRDERRLTDQELRMKTALLEAQLNSSPDAILVVDDRGRKILQNENLSRLFNFPIELTNTEDDSKLLQHTIGQVKDPKQFTERAAHLYAHRDEVGCDEIELVDGKILDRYSAPVHDREGKYYGRIWIFRDITDRKAAENALKEASRFSQYTIDSLSAHLCVLDEAGRILATNKAWRQFAESNPSPNGRANVGDNYLEVCDVATGTETADANAFAAGIRSVIQEERPEFSMEYPCHSPTEQRWFIGHVTRFPANGCVRVVVAHENITAQRKLEMQFRHSQKMEGIGQLAGGVAHDFNNILAVIQMQSDYLMTGGSLTAEQLDTVWEIGAAAQRATVLTRQLLMFSRKEMVNPHDLDLNESINDLTKMLRRTLGEHIQLQFKFAMQPLIVHADAGMMDQVLMNLAINSRDAMPEGGRLAIETSAVEFDESIREHSADARPGSFVCLSVSDTGCGIPPENLTRIFEPFFTTKDVGKGTGLGLATVYGIIQQHKGWINVYSEVGHGTTFRFYLPRLDHMSNPKGGTPSMAAIPGGTETILLVEDESFLRVSVRKSLMQLGYQVIEASNGVEALEIWAKQRDGIDMLLTDLLMPGGINGKELSRRLLTDKPKLKVVYASGYSAEIATKDFPLVEGVNFLSKPFETHRLARTIRDNLDKDVQP